MSAVRLEPSGAVVPFVMETSGRGAGGMNVLGGPDVPRNAGARREDGSPMLELALHAPVLWNRASRMPEPVIDPAESAEQAERRLVDRLRAGDEAAFMELVDR